MLGWTRARRRGKTGTYEGAREPGPLTATRSGSTPSTAKRLRSMAFMPTTISVLYPSLKYSMPRAIA